MISGLTRSAVKKRRQKRLDLDELTHLHIVARREYIAARSTEAALKERFIEVLHALFIQIGITVSTAHHSFIIDL